MSKICPNCKKEIPNEAMFCPECGATLASEITCPKCGKKLPLGARFCDECGTTLSSSQQEPQVNYSPSSSIGAILINHANAAAKAEDNRQAEEERKTRLAEAQMKADAAKAEAEKAEADAKKAEADAKKAEADAKKAEIDAKINEEREKAKAIERTRAEEERKTRLAEAQILAEAEKMKAEAAKAEAEAKKAAAQAEKVRLANEEKAKAAAKVRNAKIFKFASVASVAVLFILCCYWMCDSEPDSSELAVVSQEIESDVNTVNSNSNKYDFVMERLLTEDDLKGVSKDELRIMRNWIFARHGYKFKTADMKAYFTALDWYKGVADDVTSKLSAIEKKNIEFIKKHE